MSGGSARINLIQGSKDPDFSLYENQQAIEGSSSDPAEKKDVDSFPTVAFEVSFSQNINQVSNAAARIIGGSLGAVLLVVAINLQYRVPVQGVRAPIEKGQADYWMLTDLDLLSERPQAPCNQPILMESDDVGPTQFHFFQESIPSQDRDDLPQFSRLTISRTDTYPVRLLFEYGFTMDCMLIW